MIRDLWAHKRYILGGAIRELRYQYAGSAMGIVWHIVIPLLQITVYLIVFSQLLAGRRLGAGQGSYALFLCCGILPWFVFADCIERGSAAFVANAPYLTKLAIPESVFVAQTVLTSALNLAIYLPVLVLLAWAGGILPQWSWSLVPVVLLLFVGLGFGLALLLATLNVFFRDISQLLGITLQIWFWITPIVYGPSILPARVWEIVKWNPAAAYISSVRSLLLEGVVPDGGTWLWMGGLAVAVPYLGARVLQRLRTDLRDAL